MLSEFLSVFFSAGWTVSSLDSVLFCVFGALVACCGSWSWMTGRGTSSATGGFSGFVPACVAASSFSGGRFSVDASGGSFCPVRGSISDTAVFAGGACGLTVSFCVCPLLSGCGMPVAVSFSGVVLG